MIFTPFEPKVSFRYTLTLAGTTIPAYVCKASSMPSIDQGEIVIDHINTDFKVKGKSRWQDITITLYDPVDPSQADAVNAWLLIHHNSRNGKDNFAFPAMMGYKRDITISALAPDGETPVESWVIHGAWIKASTFGEMDWTSEEAKEIELTVSYDWAELIPGLGIGKNAMASPGYTL